jgi:phosphinothricin acetyltransferase
MPPIRLARSQDAEAVAAIYAPYCENSIVAFETTAPTAQEMAGRIVKVTQRYPWLVLDIEGEVAGYVYASQHRERAAYQWSVDVTAYTHANFQRQGVGRALYISLFQLLRLQGFYRAHAGIALPNAASVGLHQALGFQHIGIYESVGYKLGDWQDVAWFQLTLQPEQPDPPTPLPIAKVLETDSGQTALSAGWAYYRGTT